MNSNECKCDELMKKCRVLEEDKVFLEQQYEKAMSALDKIIDASRTLLEQSGRYENVNGQLVPKEEPKSIAARIVDSFKDFLNGPTPTLTEESIFD